MPCGFSTNGLDGRLLDILELVESACILTLVSVIVTWEKKSILLVVCVSRTRLIAWTKAAHVGARKEKNRLALKKKKNREPAILIITNEE